MPTLLERPLDSTERRLQESIRKILPQVPRIRFSERLWRALGLAGPEAYFSAVLSLIQLPATSSLELALCRYLLEIAEFYVYLANPNSFDRPALVNLYRAFARIDPQFDVKLISFLAGDNSVGREAFARALSVVDEMSPGRRLTMTLARVLRYATPEVASKLTLLIGRRVSNPAFVERQLAAADSRTRANVIEALWGIDTEDSRRWLLAALNDTSNRVIGNALVGLHLLRDNQVKSRLQKMVGHPDPAFRATAAWVMGRIGDQSCRPLLAGALTDPELRVRGAAEGALAAMPEDSPEAARQTDPESALHARPEPPA